MQTLHEDKESAIIRIGKIEMQIMDELDPYKAKGHTYVLTRFRGPVSIEDGVDAETGIEVMTLSNELRYAVVPIEIMGRAVPVLKKPYKEKSNLHVVKEALGHDPEP